VFTKLDDASGRSASCLCSQIRADRRIVSLVHLKIFYSIGYVAWNKNLNDVYE